MTYILKFEDRQKIIDLYISAKWIGSMTPVPDNSEMIPSAGSYAHVSDICSRAQTLLLELSGEMEKAFQDSHEEFEKPYPLIDITTIIKQDNE